MYIYIYMYMYIYIYICIYIYVYMYIWDCRRKKNIWAIKNTPIPSHYTNWLIDFPTMGYHHPQTPAQSPHHPAAQSMTTLGGRLAVALGTSTEYQVCVNVLSIHLYRSIISVLLSLHVLICVVGIYIYIHTGIPCWKLYGLHFFKVPKG